MIVFRWQWREIAFPPHALLNIHLFHKNKKKTMLKKGIRKWEVGRRKWEVKRREVGSLSLASYCNKQLVMILKWSY